MASGRVMLQLGSFQFSADTAAYQQLSRRTNFRWPSQDVLFQPPMLQYTGEGSDQISLAGVIYPDEIGDANSLTEFRKNARTGEPLRLIAFSAENQTGTILGLWSILDVSGSVSNFKQFGKPKKIEFALTISYYGPNSGR